MKGVGTWSFSGAVRNCSMLSKSLHRSHHLTNIEFAANEELKATQIRSLWMWNTFFSVRHLI